MELASTLSLEMFGEPFLLEKRIRLLYAIKEHGSISKAAKAVPMSYKSAWDAVDAMNALAPEPMVIRETGGRDGGGTVLTAYGEKLLAHYALLREEHQRFMARLEKLSGMQEGTLGTLGRMALQLSARNQIQAMVEVVVLKGVSARVDLRLKGGQLLCSQITAEAAEELGIAQGERVIAICKSSNVFILEDEEKRRENTLRGQILSLESGEESVKVVVDVGGYDRIVSVIPLRHPAASALKEGQHVTLAVKPKDVMIGR